MNTDTSPSLASQTALTPKARRILDEQLQNIFAVYGLLITLEKAISHQSYGDNDLLAFADCARAGKIILDNVTDALDNLKVQSSKPALAVPVPVIQRFRFRPTDLQREHRKNVLQEARRTRRLANASLRKRSVVSTPMWQGARPDSIT